MSVQRGESRVTITEKRNTGPDMAPTTVMTPLRTPMLRLGVATITPLASMTPEITGGFARCESHARKSRKKMSDIEIRTLERKAADGDKEAKKALLKARARAGEIQVIEVGDNVYQVTPYHGRKTDVGGPRCVGGHD
jgi:hypothetical protein